VDAVTPENDQRLAYEKARRSLADRLNTFNAIMSGPNPLTQAELRRLLEKRPEQYAFIRAWLR
jgi:hypothetical protein